MCSQPNHLTCPKVKELDRVLWRQTSNPAPICSLTCPPSHGKPLEKSVQPHRKLSRGQRGAWNVPTKNFQIPKKKRAKGWLFWNIKVLQKNKKKHEGLFWNQFFPLKPRVISDRLGFFWFSAIRHVLNSSHIQPIGDMAKHQGLLLSSFGAGPPLHWSQQHGMLCSIWLGHWISIWIGKEPQKKDGNV